MTKGKYDEAIKAYDEAISLDSNNTAAWVSKGNALNNKKKFDDAIKAYDEAIRRNPMAWYNKGIALKDQDNFDEAIKAYDEAIRLNPKYAAAWNSKGWVLYNQVNTR